MTNQPDHIHALTTAVDDLAHGGDPDTIAARFDADTGAPDILRLASILDTRPLRTHWAGDAALLPFYEAAADALRSAGYEVWVGVIPAGGARVALVGLRQGGTR